jgi:hypothetical protein
MKKIGILMFAVMSLLVFSQCKKKTTTTKTEAHPIDPNLDSYENMRVHIFSHNCVSCHSTAASSNTQHGLVLEGGDVYERLINKLPVNAQARTAGLKLVIPGKADSSFLFIKCDWKNVNFRFGNSMPLGADPLTEDQITFIKLWINAGAPKTGIVADANLLKH